MSRGSYDDTLDPWSWVHACWQGQGPSIAHSGVKLVDLRVGISCQHTGGGLGRRTSRGPWASLRRQVMLARWSS